VTKNADIRQVLLTRFTAEGKVSQTINLWETLWAKEAPRDLTLQDGDMLFIPKLADNDKSLDRHLIARSSLANRTVRVRVIGEVKRPGEVEVTSSSSLVGALAVAGGATDKADLSQVVFARMQDDGHIQQKTINLSLIDENQIEQGDVILVPKSGTSFALDLIGSIFSPLLGLGNLINVFR
jgi:polysaccharide export outer membrane protein